MCNISDNRFALQIRKKNIGLHTGVFFSMFYFSCLSLHAVPLTNTIKLLATFQDNTDNNFVQYTIRQG